MKKLEFFTRNIGNRIMAPRHKRWLSEHIFKLVSNKHYFILVTNCKVDTAKLAEQAIARHG